MHHIVKTMTLTFISLPRMSTFSILQLSSTFSTENDNFLYPSLPTPNPHTKFLGVALIPLNIYTSRLFFTIVQKTNVFCCLLNYGIMFVRRSSCICYFRRYDSKSTDFRSRPRTSKTWTSNNVICIG